MIANLYNLLKSEITLFTTAQDMGHTLLNVRTKYSNTNVSVTM